MIYETYDAILAKLCEDGILTRDERTKLNLSLLQKSNLSGINEILTKAKADKFWAFFEENNRQRLKQASGSK